MSAAIWLTMEECKVYLYDTCKDACSYNTQFAWFFILGFLLQISAKYVFDIKTKEESDYPEIFTLSVEHKNNIYRFMKYTSIMCNIFGIVIYFVSVAGYL